MKTLHALLITVILLLLCTVIGGGFWAWMLSSGKFTPEPRIEAFARNHLGATTYKVVTDKDYWPYSFVDKDGRLSGREIELMILIANEIGINIEIQPLSWEECVDAAVAHKADMVLTCAAASTGRELEALDISAPVEGDSYAIFGKKSIASFEELRGRRIGLMLDGNINSVLYAAGLKPFIHQYTSYREVLEAIGRDEIDFTVARYNPVIGWLREKPIPGVEAKMVLGKSYICIGVAKQHHELMHRINDAIGVLRVSGEVQRLTDKWLTTYVKPQGLYETIQLHPKAFVTLLSVAVSLIGLIVILIFMQFRASRRAQESKVVIEGLTGRYNVAFIVNLKTGSLEVVRRDMRMFNYDREFGDFAEIRDYFLAEDVHDRDRERMRMEFDPMIIRRKLVENSSYEVEFCLLKNGVTSLGEMKVMAISGDIVAFGMAIMDLELVQRHLSSQRYAEYFAMFAVDVDTAQLKVLKKSPWDTKWPQGGSFPYSEVIGSIAKKTGVEYRGFYERLADLDQARKLFDKDDKFTYSYPSGYVEGGKWVTVNGRVIVVHDDGTPALFTLSFILTDAIGVENLELQRQVKESLTFMNYFVATFVSTYYVNLKTHACRVCHRTDLLARDYPKIKDYLTTINEYIDRDVHPDDREAMKEFIEPENMKRAFADKSIIAHVFRDISHAQEKTYRFQAIKGADENCAAFTFSDITEVVRKEHEQKKQLEDALSMAQSANRAKTTFLNNMSHDIRTPMNAVIGYTRLAKTHIDSRTLVEDYLTKIGQSSDHLLALINDVLDMARIESGKLRISEASESLPDIIHTIRNLIQSQVTAKQLDFFIDCRDVKDENIVCDKLRLSQLLLNIVSNAVKYTPATGMVSLHVIEAPIASAADDLAPGRARYIFTVKDTGCGMSPEFLQTVFEPFSRAKNSTASGVQGTGLGMTIVKNITNMMGGKIDIKSELDRGTEVTVTFDFALGESKREMDAEIASLKGMRVLVADDDMDSCVSIAGMLEKFGIRSEWCTSGKEAVVRSRHAHASGEDFDAYLFDWQMPGMNGVEAARQIRKEIGDEPAIIIHSSYDWGTVESEAKEVGVTAFMSKPLFASELKKVLLKAICAKDGTALANRKSEPHLARPADAPAPEIADASTPAVNLAGKRILLVEDNETNCEITAEFLAEQGVMVDTAVNGLEGVASARNGKYDLILMDIQMPVMDGYEATKRIRDAGIDVPIVALTADAFIEDRQTALDSGMNDHLAKPIDFDDLLACIVKHLSEKK